MVWESLDEDYERHKIRLSWYTEDSQCLIVTVTTSEHEETHGLLYQQLTYQIRDMGLEFSWKLKGTATIYPRRSSGGGGGGGGKQPDASGGPRPERSGSYPTIVFEGGYSQTLTSMRLKARQYFADSDHDIKIVILAKLIPTQRKIIIERWEERQQGVPGCQQEITITGNRATPSVYQVSGGDLILSFRLLFLRDPLPGEGDVVYPVAWLRHYAQSLWDTWDQYAGT